MYFRLLNILVPAFVLPWVAEGNPASGVLLTNQCWHESPLSRVILQSTTDQISELVTNTDMIDLVGFSTALSGGTSGSRKTISPYAPWTHRPICTDTLPSLGSKLCVYTNDSFSNGRGISIFTTPKVAEEFAYLPAFQDPQILRKMDVNINSGSWYTQELAGKGVGMVAKKTLKFK